MQQERKKVPVKWLIAAAVLAAVGIFAWQELRPRGLGDGFASGNGRIEATDIDVATKLPGRIIAINVDEGDFVQPGQILASMDTASLEAQLTQARADVARAQNAILTARALVAQRQSEKDAAQAVVLQRQAELDAADKRFHRSDVLVQRNALARQQLDDDRANMLSARAALVASRAQVLSAEAAIRATESQVIEAESNLDAVKASVTRLQVDVDDSQLKTDRIARVQYRVAEPGEVLQAGGKVLNLVDLTDVYMTFFLPTRQAGRVAMGSDVRLVLDAMPQSVLPAKVSYVASVAQFTPKTVETEVEREKLMFRLKARIDPALLRKHLKQIKTGLPGVAYVKLDDTAQWPERLQVNVEP